jgi:hypothetical protein
MKTAYQKPTLVVVKVKAKHHIMAGSVVGIGKEFNNSIENGDKVLSRRGRNTYWEDDEE